MESCVNGNDFSGWTYSPSAGGGTRALPNKHNREQRKVGGGWQKYSMSSRVCEKRSIWHVDGKCGPQNGTINRDVCRQEQHANEILFAEDKRCSNSLKVTTRDQKEPATRQRVQNIASWNSHAER